MSDELKRRDPGAVWRDQPAEKLAVNLERFVNRRTQELYSSTRSEVMVCIGAALLFVAVLAWRFASAQDRFLQLGYFAAVAWILISVYWFRRRIWREAAPDGDARAATGLEYYRNELERRRNHLRNEWLWHGPLVLACMALIGVLMGKAFVGMERLRNTTPLAVLLAAWTVVGIRNRLRQARELQREIEEIELL